MGCRTAPEGSERYYYDLVNGAVINGETVEKGLTISVDGVDFRILLTWWNGASTINNTSVIMKMEYRDNSVLFLGDCGEEEGRRLLEVRSAEEVKSDYIQLGHHGQGGPDPAVADPGMGMEQRADICNRQNALLDGSSLRSGGFQKREVF